MDQGLRPLTGGGQLCFAGRLPAEEALEHIGIERSRAAVLRRNGECVEHRIGVHARGAGDAIGDTVLLRKALADAAVPDHGQKLGLPRHGAVKGGITVIREEVLQLLLAVAEHVRLPGGDLFQEVTLPQLPGKAEPAVQRLLRRERPVL